MRDLRHWECRLLANVALDDHDVVRGVSGRRQDVTENELPLALAMRARYWPE